MLFKDQILFVLQHMKKNKLRVTMTVLATMIGCSFLIVLASVGFGIQETMRNEILNQEQITQIELWGNETLTEEDKKFIEEIEHVNVVLKKESINSTIHSKLEGREGDSNGTFIDISAQKKLPSNLSEGRLPETTNEIVVGFHYAQSLLNETDKAEIERKSKAAQEEGGYYDGADEGYKGEILNKKVELQFFDETAEQYGEPISFTIVGILKEPTYDWYIDSSIVFHDELRNAYPALITSPTTLIYVDSLEHVMPVLDELKEKKYQVYSQVEQLEELDLFFLIFKLGLLFIGTIAILIASIGIFNTMTMAVTERTREIGVLKAIGASPNLIQRLFLMESTFIGLLGTILAIGVSYIISFLANAILPHIVSYALSDENIMNHDITFSMIPLSLVIIAGSISILVAIFSGWRPARKATKIQVIHALRQEL
ncbi:acetoin utilization transport system permease protein [Ureibacillus xyleni]|uniref:Acetoin utilization transport system permease protein n=1 Tax=Ureibacillus xyleni TaxID=614648 RepID=A0A285RHJ5_9BACL|nr:FtsX-like permease family protein [Ureibacillus xyleni]SOB93364.1 acetoin utilization transport system permease protein [Ureibacillus xyleni]